MAFTKTFLALSASSAAIVSAATPYAVVSTPSCTSDYVGSNDLLRMASIGVRQEYGVHGAALGIYSVHIAQYMGFGDLVPRELDPITQATEAFIIPLRQAKIKCNTCKAKDGSLRYSHPYRKPVLDFTDLEGMFDVGTNVIEGSLLYKYCDEVNNGVCLDYPPYCSDAPPGQEFPDKSVKPSMRRYVKANLVSRPLHTTTYDLLADVHSAAFGTGPASSKGGLPALRKGAIYPYYKCLAEYGDPKVVVNFESKWFTFMHNILTLNQTACV